ncbi:asparaginase [Rhodococcus sp. Q]|uniref:asparaginase n=1 Tax=Rhodococcus sp. Q TaxID=2502252 RepID=UPI0010F69F57|nr:asparaginase [Rhodococcus sp. Q]
MSVELVEVVRSGFRECVHRGSLVVLDPSGETLLAVGEVNTPIFPRSANKPLQTVAMLRNGFVPADSREVALATSSHGGEPEHVAGVLGLLERNGLTERELRCPPDLPWNDIARARVLAVGGSPRRVFMNCSGKHAAMVAVCAARDWPLESYLDAAHPLQQEIQETIADLSGEDEYELGIDGCGLPIVPLSLTALARAFARLVTGAPDTAERTVADAVREHPWQVSGTGLDDERLMSTVPGLLCKVGADGVHAGALPDGRAFALKIDDGSERARIPLTAAILHRIGVEWTEDLAELASAPVLGGGVRVGTIRAIPEVLR